MAYYLKRGNLKRFLNSLNKTFDVIAPVKTDIVKFQKITEKNSERVNFTENSRLSPISFLFLNKEEIFEIKNNKLIPKYEKEKPKIVFGIRNCDTNSILSLDKMFLDEYKDPYYEQRRKNTLLFELECEEPDEFCFCDSMENKDLYDAKFFIDKNGFILYARTEKAKEIFSRLKTLKIVGQTKKQPKKRKKCSLYLDNKDIKKHYNDATWEKDAELCFSCSICNMLCPTCTCFDVYDKVNPDLKTGKRIRVKDGCHNRDFTKVAGNYIFRDKRIDRFKHRIYHKIDYFKDRYNMYMCTGCGRCISQCPSKINWVKTLNKFKK